MSPRVLSLASLVLLILFCRCGGSHQSDPRGTLPTTGLTDPADLARQSPDVHAVTADLPILANSDGLTTRQPDLTADIASLPDVTTSSCTPGTTRCQGQQLLRCDDAGQEQLATSCGESEVCAGGQCISACQWQNQKRGYLGCRYLAADLPSSSSHLEDKSDPVFAFAFSNPDPQHPASVTITYPDGTQVTLPVGPSALATHALPDRSFALTASTTTLRGFLIESDRPISAVMFNPLEQELPDGQFAGSSNDASLLLPIAALGTSYMALNWQVGPQSPSPSFITIIGAEDATTVTITPRAEITMPQGAPTVAGSSRSFSLNQRDLLNLQSAGDLSGSMISATKPVAVFSGNVCANVPVDGIYCDHLETQLPPLTGWGKTVVVTKYTDRGGEADYIRVLAMSDNTALTFTPPRADLPVLKQGELFQFSSKSSVVISASKPILVGQFMASQSETVLGPFGKLCPKQTQPGSCVGDPSLVLPPPLEQWRTDYIFLIPETYLYNFINIAASSQTQLLLDGEPVTNPGTPIGDSGFVRIVLPVAPGFHRLQSSIASALIVYGYDYNVSYSYVGGLDARILTP